MLIRQVADDKLAQYAYLVGCQQTGEAIVIDPERDVDQYLALAAREGLRLVAVAETHIHADFLSGSRELAARVPGLRVYLSAEGGQDWAYAWPAQDGLDAVLLRDGDTFRTGHIELRAWHTPGHTPEHLSYVVTDHGAGATVPMAIFSGDFLFVNDLGRPDLLESAVGVRGAMQGAARRLHASALQLDAVEDFVQVWPGHGAGSACGKALGAIPTTTVGYERRVSPALARAAEGEQAFVDFILADQPEPPLYFAEMKHLNRAGAEVLGGVPTPRRLTADEVDALAGRDDVQVVDTGRDRRQFLAGHLPGALYAPLDKSFTTTVGSMLDPALRIVLLADESSVDEAVRDLMRIGYDGLIGWAPASVVDELRDRGTKLAAIESIDFPELERRRAADAIAVLDVRTASEYRARHIPDATNIAHTRLRARLDELDTTKPIYVHCAAGARAAVSAALVARAGRDVVHVDGTFAAWQPTAAGVA
jgi:hydroxyacylglutathione hydrolase